MAGNNRRHIRNDGNSYNRLLMAIKVGNGAERGDKIVAVLDPRISPIRVGENRWPAKTPSWSWCCPRTTHDQERM